jgi:hypothetical protein
MAYRDGYFQALKDLHNDGILSAEEFKKREAQMEVSNFSPEIKKFISHVIYI